MALVSTMLRRWTRDEIAADPRGFLATAEALATVRCGPCGQTTTAWLFAGETVTEAMAQPLFWLEAHQAICPGATP